MADVDYDDERHRREQAALRAKRKAAREHKSESQREKDRKRREHAQRVLSKHKRGGSSQPPPPPDDGGSSVFQSLFTKRAEGFQIELKFRNAPPRPPVGPCFVGLGLEGELHDKWTKYKPLNAVEVNYSWRLHSEPDLGVPLAPSAMDLEGCYVDPTNVKSKNRKIAAAASVFHEIEDEDDDDDANDKANDGGPPPVHPNDQALIQWTGSLGDTAAEQLQLKRDRARAAARLRGTGGARKLTTAAATTSGPITTTVKRTRITTKKGFRSRVLDEDNPFFMKKTTYLANDPTKSVHRFTSLADQKAKAAEELALQLEQSKSKLSDVKTIERAFEMANSNVDTNTDTTNQRRRQHPTKKNVTPVWDLPLLPDVTTWGHTYTHVVLDGPPRQVRTKSGIVTGSTDAAQLERAFISDVERRAGSARMECNLLTPTDIVRSDASEPTLYEVVQRYDLDVIPLKDEGMPHVNFVLMVDEKNGVVTYHPVNSRVQLSTGRPPTKKNSVGSIIAKRAPEEEDVKEMEIKVAEVDIDLAQKYGLDDGAGGISGVGGGGGGGLQQQRAKSREFDDDDDDSGSDRESGGGRMGRMDGMDDVDNEDETF